jgi:hypothetical protein
MCKQQQDHINDLQIENYDLIVQNLELARENLKLSRQLLYVQTVIEHHKASVTTPDTHIILMEKFLEAE